MAQRSLRPCKQRGCSNLTRDVSGYCEEHSHTAEEKKVERHKQYDKYARDKKSKEFYHSKEWTKLRKVAMVRDYGLCQECLKENKIISADVVHHIAEVRKDWDNRLVLENLTCLCHGCHNKIHGQK